MWLPVAGAVPAKVSLRIPADLETDVTSRDVDETLTVERADLYVFDRLGFDRKISRLCPRNRDKSCRGAEKKTLRYHFEPPICIGGSASARSGYHPTGSFPHSIQVSDVVSGCRCVF